jgi:predicted enzyme related to lactoylglutathione lyase
MPESPQFVKGSIAWADLTVENATEISEFYKQVVGWGTSKVELNGYADYCMTAPRTGTPIAGVCHARGENAGLPPQWLMYVVVENLDRSLEACVKMGGKTLTPIRSYGPQSRFCVIQDPVGAILALYQTKSSL